MQAIVYQCMLIVKEDILVIVNGHTDELNVTSIATKAE